MKALFLGTGAGWPLPRLGCHCPICSSNDKRDRRLRPALLVNNKFLLDAPPDIYRQLRRYPKKINRIESIFITHAHLDHILGLYDLTHTYFYKGKNLHKQRFNLFLTEETLRRIKKVFAFPLSIAFNICSVRENETFSVGGAKVIFFTVHHSSTPTWGIRIRKEGVISYLPDFADVPIFSQKIIKGSDVLVLDGTNLLMKQKINSNWGHADWETIINLVEKVKAKKIFFTHIGHGHNSAPHEKLSEFVQKKGGQNRRIAYDGMEIEI